MRILNLNCYRRLILVALIVLLPFRVWAIILVDYVNVTQAGKLGSLLTTEQKNTIENLCVTGNLNGSDILVLQDMANASMTYLDLQNANIVTGGDAYYIWTSSYTQSYNTKANVIGAYMFYKCTSLKTVYLPNSVTTIESGAFGYSSLRSITIGPKVTSITAGLCAGTPLDEIALDGNTAFVLDEGILYDKAKTTVYKAVTGIEGDITLPSSVSTIMNSSFSGTGLRSIVIPSKVTEITTATFSDCQNLEDVTFPSGLIDLGYDCFGHCPKLKKIDLSGTKVTKIYMSFYNCQNLEEIILPSTLKEITGSSFTSYAMKKITCAATTPPTLEDASYRSFAYTNIASSCKVYVPKGRVNTYKSATGWKRFNYVYEIGSEPEDDSLEAYAVYTDDGTLTFYYDKQKNSRNGTKYELNTDKNAPGWYTDHRKDIKKVVFNPSFSEARPTSTYRWFSVNYDENSALSQIVDLQYLNTSSVTQMMQMFYYCKELTSLDLSHFNTSNVRDMSFMFYNCSNLASLNVSGFDTKNLTNMSYMFSGCSSLTNLDVSNFDTSNVTNMSSVFFDCSSLTSLNVGGFDTRNVTNMSYMFRRCSSLANLDISHFNTSKVTDMKSLFSECGSLEKVDVSHFNTSNVTDMSFMFSLCGSLTNVDLSNFDTKQVTDMSFMFQFCSLMTKIELGNFVTSKVVNMKGMFANCSNLTDIDLSNFDTSEVRIMDRMFYNCNHLTTIDLSHFNTSNMTSTADQNGGMFQHCTNLTTIYVGYGWNANKVSYSENMFRNCTKLVGGAGTKYDSNHVDVAYAHIDSGPSNPGYFTDKNAPDAKEAYAVYTDDCTLTFYYDNQKDSRSGTKYSLNIDSDQPGWHKDHRKDIKKVVFDSSFAGARPTSTYSWFGIYNNYEESILSEIVGIEYLNTSAVTNMRYMFRGCVDLTSLDVSSFDTSNVLDMGAMFYECKNVNSLDVSHFDTSKVTDMEYMFYECRNITNLDLSNFDTSNVTSMYCMFLGCHSLTSLDLSHFDTREVTNMYAMFNGCNNLASLDMSHFNTSNVVTMSLMFAACQCLTDLDISSFDTGDVTGMESMFTSCTALTTIYSGKGWNTEKVTRSENMFINCPNLVGGAGTTYDASHVDVAYAHIDGGPSNPGYLTDIDAQQGELLTTGCDEDWLQKKLDEIAAQKPSEPVELTICEDGITLTKNILVAKDCKAVLTGGPITSEAFIDYRHGAEGVFMVYGELGFHDISLTFNNDAKNDGSHGYFWLGDGTLKMLENTVVNTTNGTVVGGWGQYELKSGTVTAGGNEMVINSSVEADISGSVKFVGAQTYCNGRLSLDITFSEAGYVQIPSFRVNDIYVTSTLDIYAPLSTLPVYLYKDATINTEEGGIAVLTVAGEWDKMTPGRAIVTSTSITQEDYEGMTFDNLPTNLKAEFVPEMHQVQLVTVEERNIQNNLDGLMAGDQTTPVVIDVASDAVSMLSQPATVSHANVTFNGMQDGSASRGRLHFAKDQTLTVSQGSLVTLTNLDVTGEGGSECFVVKGQLVIGENVHVSDFTCFLCVQNGGSVGVSGPLVSTITLRYVNGLTDGQTVIVGTDGYQLTEQDLSLVSVEDCELKLDMTNNRIDAVNPTSIREIEKSSSEMAGGYYDLSGRHVLAPRQGVYIMKSEGKTRKVYVK